MEKTELTKALTLTSTATSYLNRNIYLIATKQKKTINMAVIQIRIIISFTLNFLSKT